MGAAMAAAGLAARPGEAGDDTGADGTKNNAVGAASGASLQAISSNHKQRFMRRQRYLYNTIAGYGTRFLLDMLTWRNILVVVPSAAEAMHPLLTTKPPGLLNVKSAARGRPVVATATTKKRKIQNPHPCLGPDFVVQTVQKHEITRTVPEEPVPELTREQADSNLLLRALIRGSAPYRVSGAEVSVYAPGALTTKLAGVHHNWCVVGALVNKYINTPRTPETPWGLFPPGTTEEAKKAAKDFLYIPFHNAAVCEIYKGTDGAWNKPETRLYGWTKGYGVSIGSLRDAMFWLMYPTYEYDWLFPGDVDILRLKWLAECEVHFMGRMGRIARFMLNNRKRSIRRDLSEILRNYVRNTRDASPPGSPVANVCISALNIFRNSLILGKRVLKHRDTRTLGTKNRQGSAAVGKTAGNGYASEENSDGGDGGGDRAGAGTALCPSGRLGGAGGSRARAGQAGVAGRGGGLTTVAENDGEDDEDEGEVTVMPDDDDYAMDDDEEYVRQGFAAATAAARAAAEQAAQERKSRADVAACGTHGAQAAHMDKLARGAQGRTERDMFALPYADHNQFPLGEEDDDCDGDDSDSDDAAGDDEEEFTTARMGRQPERREMSSFASILLALGTDVHADRRRGRQAETAACTTNSEHGAGLPQCVGPLPGPAEAGGCTDVAVHAGADVDPNAGAGDGVGRLKGGRKRAAKAVAAADIGLDVSAFGDSVAPPVIIAEARRGMAPRSSPGARAFPAAVDSARVSGDTATDACRGQGAFNTPPMHRADEHEKTKTASKARQGRAAPDSDDDDEECNTDEDILDASDEDNEQGGDGFDADAVTGAPFTNTISALSLALPHLHMPAGDGRAASCSAWRESLAVNHPAAAGTNVTVGPASVFGVAGCGQSVVGSRWSLAPFTARRADSTAHARPSSIVQSVSCADAGAQTHQQHYQIAAMVGNTGSMVAAQNGWVLPTSMFSPL
jgi:hypothetical protein